MLIYARGVDFLPPPLSNSVTPSQIRLFTFLLGGGLEAAELTLEVAQGGVGERRQ